MIAVVYVRAGVVPLGGAEAVAEAGGTALLVGTGTEPAAGTFTGGAVDVIAWETGSFAPSSLADGLADLLAWEEVVVLPASPDGRDLAPRLARALGRPLYAPAMAISPQRVSVIRGGGQRLEEHAPAGPFVATLQPGVRGVLTGPVPIVTTLERALPDLPDPDQIALLDADPATVGLADARRIIAAGAGLGSRELVDLTAAVATALGASFGATRVVTDAGWAPPNRQIGTTGVVVDPEVYVALGISGAVQHVTGIGNPGTVVAVNTDASCPMMALADLSIVADARAVLRELAALLGIAVPAERETENA